MLRLVGVVLVLVLVPPAGGYGSGSWSCPPPRSSRPHRADADVDSGPLGLRANKQTHTHVSGRRDNNKSLPDATCVGGKTTTNKIKRQRKKRRADRRQTEPACFELTSCQSPEASGGTRPRAARSVPTPLARNEPPS